MTRRQLLDNKRIRKSLLTFGVTLLALGSALLVQSFSIDNAYVGVVAGIYIISGVICGIFWAVHE